MTAVEAQIQKVVSDFKKEFPDGKVADVKKCETPEIPLADPACVNDKDFFDDIAKKKAALNFNVAVPPLPFDVEEACVNDLTHMIDKIKVQTEADLARFKVLSSSMLSIIPKVYANAFMAEFYATCIAVNSKESTGTGDIKSSVVFVKGLETNHKKITQKPASTPVKGVFDFFTTFQIATGACQTNGEYFNNLPSNSTIQQILDLSLQRMNEVVSGMSQAGNKVTGTGYSLPQLRDPQPRAELNSFFKDSIGNLSEEAAKNFADERRDKLVSILYPTMLKYNTNRKEIIRYVNLLFAKGGLPKGETAQQKYLGWFKSHVNYVNNNLDDLLFFVNYHDSEYSKNKVKEIMGATKICGKQVPTEEFAPPSPMRQDNNNIGFTDKPEMDDITKIPYWLLYASVLNTVALSPTFWTTGFIGPNGPIKMPIVWIPVFVFKTPTSLYVLWITINGVLVFPVLWQWKCNTIENNESLLRVAFKGINKTIKFNTGTDILGNKITDLIKNTTPKVNGTMPSILETPNLMGIMYTDDVPTYPRTNIKNPLLMNYCRQWCQTATPVMGLV